ncbi:MAG TPA: hypothetical protein DCP08_02820 [Chloroflexi bacterium]|nr:hypothetical protein [Chloroflexota bacterium]
MNSIAVSPEVIGPLSWEGLEAHCLGYVLDNRSYGQLIYLSLVGFRTAVRGIWAALMGNRWLEVDGRSIHRAAVKYQRITTRLPEQGLDHLVLIHPQATLKFIEPGKPFYVLSDTQEPPLARFLAMLDKTTRVPLLPQWANTLWESGIETELIETIEATRGTFAWRVSAQDDTWLKVIQEGIDLGRLTG